MKRDMNLIRTLLLHLEDKQKIIHTDEIVIHDVEAENIAYHVHLMSEAGMVAIQDAGTKDNRFSCFVLNITYQGHDYLDSVRSPRIWKQIQAISQKAGLSLTEEAVKTLAKKMVITALTATGIS